MFARFSEKGALTCADMEGEAARMEAAVRFSGQP